MRAATSKRARPDASYYAGRVSVDEGFPRPKVSLLNMMTCRREYDGPPRCTVMPRCLYRQEGPPFRMLTLSGKGLVGENYALRDTCYGQLLVKKRG